MVVTGASKVEPVFKIPAKYDEVFVLGTEHSLTYLIVDGADGRIGLIQAHSGEQPCPREESTRLDWIQETMERIRFECENWFEL